MTSTSTHAAAAVPTTIEEMRMDKMEHDAPAADEEVTNGEANDEAPPTQEQRDQDEAAPDATAPDTPVDDSMKDSNNDPPRPSYESEESLSRKRKASGVVAEESKKRGRRMFGLLQSTLKQAKVDTGNLSEAAKKRQELEQKLQSKLLGERREMMDKRDRIKEMRELTNEIVAKEEDMKRLEKMMRARHDIKLDLAEFLCTSFSGPSTRTSDPSFSSPSFVPRVPQSLHVTHPSAPRPIFYMPYRLLGSQEDRIDDQITDVEKAIKREKVEWEDKKRTKLDEIDELKRRRDDLKTEGIGAERTDERQRSRNDEDEQRAPRERSESRGENTAMDLEAEQVREGEDGGVDEKDRMIDDSGAPRSPSNAGEDEVEY